MNHQERIELLKALREAGATHFKSPEMEVTLSGSILRPLEAPTSPSEPLTQPILPVDPSQVPAESPSPYNAESTKKVEDVIDLLKLKDDELIDKIFPV